MRWRRIMIIERNVVSCGFFILACAKIAFLFFRSKKIGNNHAFREPFPRNVDGFFFSLVYPNHGARFRFSFTQCKDNANRAQHNKLAWLFCRDAAYLMQRYNIFLDFASLYLISFFSLTFFIIHYVYYTISNYPEIFLQPRKYFSLVREILWV